MSGLKKYIFVFLIGILFLLFYLYACRFFPGLPGYHEIYFTPKAYEESLKKITLAQHAFSEEYHINSNKTHTEKRARTYFFDALNDDLFNFWLGTSYDFYGQTHVPGKGEIACGYFVTTLLEDMGCKINRNGLAKMASENMIKNLVQEKYIKRYSNQTLNRFLDDVRFQGKGIYVVGLDTHTGFIVNDGDEIYFVHASGRNPWQVVEERASDSLVLEASSYRVLGSLSHDPEFVKKWISGNAF